MTDSLDLSFLGLHELDAALKAVNGADVACLNARGNKLSSLPHDLRRFGGLRRLDLSCNELLRLPEWIKELKNLEELVLDENCLQELPEEVFLLSSLRILSVASNELATISRNVVRLARLEVLDLWGNQLGELPGLSTLRQLKELNVGGNRLTRLPLGLIHCRHLHTLAANANFLTELHPEIGEISSLVNLGISNNRLTALPASLGRASNLTIISALGNPLESPSLRTVAEGTEATKAFLRGIESSAETSVSHEARLFVLGDADVGKTALVERLVHDIFVADRRATDGLAIVSWTLQTKEMPAPLSINVWDFGGQEIFHSTHRYFLSSNAVYVVVLDPTISDVLARLEYWLHVVYAADRDANVIIVATKLDQGRVDLDLRFLKEHFPAIVSFYQVSCSSPHMRGSELAALRDELAACCWGRSNIQWPGPWLAMRDELESVQTPYVTMSDFVARCATHGIDQQSASALVGLLHQLGAVLHFAGNEWLGNFLIVQPEWATRPVYALLSSSREQVVDGRLPAPALQSLLHELTPGDLIGRQIIRELMLKFGLMYHLRQADEYVIPELLPESPPADLPAQGSPWVSVLYIYRFMHPGLIPELIIKLRDHIFLSSETVAVQWRHGFALKMGDAMAVVREDRLRKQLVVTAARSGALRLRDHVQTNVDVVNRWHNAAVSIRYPCRCSPDCQHSFSPSVVGDEAGVVRCEITGRQVAVELIRKGEVTIRSVGVVEPDVAAKAQLTTIYAENVHMGDKITSGGDAFLSKGDMKAIGSSANILGSNIQSEGISVIGDGAALKAELRSLAEASKQAKLSPVLIDVVEDASRKTESGDYAAAQSALKKLGTESYELAKKVGLPLLTAYLKQSLGL